MVIQHNLQSMNANRQLGIDTGVRTKSTEKLSSGYKINRGADDAAGLAISEKMRWQIRGLDKASVNASDGISLIQTAEGALNEVHSMLQRMKELSVQAANDTNTSIDRSQLQLEINQLTSEIDRIASSTQFNTMNLLDGTFEEHEGNPAVATPYQFGDKTYIFQMVGVNGKVGSISDATGGVANTLNEGETALANFAKNAAASAVSKLYSAYPELFSNAATDGVKVGLTLENIDGANNTLATAGISYSYNNSSTMMEYTMTIDTTDYPPGNFASMGEADKADLAATIAHEMTHVAMYDTLTTGMTKKGNEYPDWFVEGMAQTSSGDNGWVSHHLNPSSSDGDIRSYMNNTTYRSYGSGYIASMYLGQLASGSDTVSADSIKTGLNKFLGDLASGKTLNEVIAKYTPYRGVRDFENNVFKNADSGTVGFTKKLLQARGANGAGSLLAGNLATTEVAAFANPSGTSSYYAVDAGYKSIRNDFGDRIDLERGGLGFDPGMGKALKLQVGALSGQAIKVSIDAMDSESIGLINLSVASFEKAGDVNHKVDKAIDKVSTQRAKLGAAQNRLEHTIANLDNTSENVSAAESRIRDTDMAREMVRYSTMNIIEQAAQSMLTQANQTPQGVLSLLQ